MDISVVVPCYNVAPWVEEALRSIVYQTIKPKEIIVVDDESTDDTLELVKSLNIECKIVHTKRAGGAGARNAGVAAAQCKWIAFLDADDAWLPEHLEHACDVLRNGKDVAYLGCAEYLLSDGTVIEMDNPWPIHSPTSGINAMEFLQYFFGKVYFCTPTVVVRRDRFNAIGGFDDSQVRLHDLDFWLRLIHNHSWSFDPRRKVRVRLGRPGSISSNFANREYFFLRCFLKNRDLYPGLEMDKFIRLRARLAMSTAYMYGDKEDCRRNAGLAWPHLSSKDKVIFGLFWSCPGLFSFMNGMRRRILGMSEAYDAQPSGRRRAPQ